MSNALQSFTLAYRSLPFNVGSIHISAPVSLRPMQCETRASPVSQHTRLIPSGLVGAAPDSGTTRPAGGTGMASAHSEPTGPATP